MTICSFPLSVVCCLSPKATKRLVVCWWASTTFSEGETMDGLGSLVVGEMIRYWIPEFPYQMRWLKPTTKTLHYSNAHVVCLVLGCPLCICFHSIGTCFLAGCLNSSSGLFEPKYVGPVIYAELRYLFVDDRKEILYNGYSRCNRINIDYYRSTCVIEYYFDGPWYIVPRCIILQSTEWIGKSYQHQPFNTSPENDSCAYNLE